MTAAWARRCRDPDAWHIVDIRQRPQCIAHRGHTRGSQVKSSTRSNRPTSGTRGRPVPAQDSSRVILSRRPPLRSPAGYATRFQGTSPRARRRPHHSVCQEGTTDVGSDRERLRGPADRSAGVRAGAAAAAGFRRRVPRTCHRRRRPRRQDVCRQPQRLVAASAASGAMFGLLLGLLFFVPGMVLHGGAIGALMGTSTNRASIPRSATA